LYFPVQGACAHSLGPGDLLTAVPRLRAWLAAHPTCRQLPLTSVFVGLPHGLRRRWCRGKTERGVGLGSSLKEVLVAYGPPEEAQPWPVAGTRRRNDPGVWEYPAGLQIFFRPEKAQKLKEAQVVRMVLFLHQRSHSGLP
ncbi:MAG: hypothetical protein RMI39_09380, partial [Thermoanaerobaculum sp.]|nr:hypothetical protein [Thermoanaerobaculum sp.]